LSFWVKASGRKFGKDNINYTLPVVPGPFKLVERVSF
jgi:hypothetical protein